MICKKCGRSNDENDRHCMGCGADLTAKMDKGPLENGLLLKIFAAVFGAYYLLQALLLVPPVLSNLISITVGIRYAFTYAAYLIGNVLKLASCAVFAYVQFLFALEGAEKKGRFRDTLYFCTVAAAGLRILAEMLNVFLRAIGYSLKYKGFFSFSYWMELFLMVAFIAVVIEGILLGILMISGGRFSLATKDELLSVMKKATEGFVKQAEGYREKVSVSKTRPQSAWSADSGLQSQPAWSADSGPQSQPMWSVGSVENASQKNDASEWHYSGNGQSQNGEWQHSGNVQPRNVPQPLKTDRSLPLYIILTLVTCGIYRFYFLYTIARDMNLICEGDGKRTPELLEYIVFYFVTCGIYDLYWGSTLIDRMAYNGSRYHVNVEENGMTYILWCFPGVLLCLVGPFMAMHILINNMNKLARGYNEAHHF